MRGVLGKLGRHHQGPRHLPPRHQPLLPPVVSAENRWSVRESAHAYAVLVCSRVPEACPVSEDGLALLVLQ